MSAATTLKLSSPFDAHVHLRQGALMKLVAPHVARGGVKACFVMVSSSHLIPFEACSLISPSSPPSLPLPQPNLVPPLTKPSQTMDYLTQLQAQAPQTQFLMSLYLTRSLTPSMIREAHSNGIVGVKSYPRGVTTNSEGGVGMEGYSIFDEVFAEMEKCDMVLNLHGEVPSDVDGDGTCVLNAEERFLPHLREIHNKFPKLRIVLEHCTTAAAVECVKTLPSNVCATITPHHLSLTIDQAVSSSLHFCKPLAKYPSDRSALRSVIAQGHPQFFLGSDSAPHPSEAKLPMLNYTHTHIDGVEGQEIVLPSPCAAGIYTQADLIPLVATIFEKAEIPLERMEGYVSEFGRRFYRIPAKKGEEVELRRVEGKKVEKAFGFEGEKCREFVVPFMAGEELGWELVV
ncbi:BQ2448_703 [Microbotryum intermedium]|uniref:BQ2448_703 protein n=1 Tax=Microbotryum intermedium TaxID=269621 RepID=A0A238F354_9BASI|nr:BQ2448_703 [Microbotryum intermedium]